MTDRHDGIDLSAIGERLAEAVRAIADAVDAGGLPAGFRRSPEVSSRITPRFSEAFAACGWPGSNPADDVIEYGLTVRVEGPRSRFEAFVGTDQGETLEPVRETWSEHLPGSEDWTRFVTDWLRTEMSREQTARVIRHAIAAQQAETLGV